jgi:hypothetical protein
MCGLRGEVNMAHPKKWYDDLSGWTPEMITAKIREIENTKTEAYNEYVDTVIHCNEVLRILQNAISNADVYR